MNATDVIRMLSDFEVPVERTAEEWIADLRASPDPRSLCETFVRAHEHVRTSPRRRSRLETINQLMTKGPVALGVIHAMHGAVPPGSIPPVSWKNDVARMASVSCRHLSPGTHALLDAWVDHGSGPDVLHKAFHSSGTRGPHRTWVIASVRLHHNDIHDENKLPMDLQDLRRWLFEADIAYGEITHLGLVVPGIPAYDECHAECRNGNEA